MSFSWDHIAAWIDRHAGRTSTAARSFKPDSQANSDADVLERDAPALEKRHTINRLMLPMDYHWLYAEDGNSGPLRLILDEEPSVPDHYWSLIVFNIDGLYLSSIDFHKNILNDEPLTVGAEIATIWKRVERDLLMRYLEPSDRNLVRTFDLDDSPCSWDWNARAAGLLPIEARARYEAAQAIMARKREELRHTRYTPVIDRTDNSEDVQFYTENAGLRRGYCATWVISNGPRPWGSAESTQMTQQLTGFIVDTCPLGLPHIIIREPEA